MHLWHTWKTINEANGQITSRRSGASEYETFQVILELQECACGKKRCRVHKLDGIYFDQHAGFFEQSNPSFTRSGDGPCQEPTLEPSRRAR